MVDLSKLAADVRTRIEGIMSQEGSAEKIDSRNEYNQLAKLLSGDGKVTGEQKGIVEGMLRDYEEEFMVRPEVKNKVKDLIKSGEENKADDNNEIESLKEYSKTKGLSKEEKTWIKSVIKGREVKFQTEATGVAPTNNSPDEGSSSAKKSEAGEATNPEPSRNETPAKKEDVSRKTVIKNNNNNNRVNNNHTRQEGKVNIDDTQINIETVNIYNSSVGKEDDETKPEIPEGDNSGKPNKLSYEEARKAENNGAKVANDLIGYTNTEEQKRVANIIKNEVNSENVIAFLRGYEENSAGGNHFFEQMESEYGFNNAQTLMLDLAGKLEKYIQNKYGVDSTEAKQISNILAASLLEEKHAEQLDKIVQKELE